MIRKKGDVMNKILAIMAVLVLSATAVFAATNYGYFVGEKSSFGQAVVTSNYNRCDATINTDSGETYFLSQGTATNLAGVIECTGKGGIIHADKTIEHGTATLTADSSSASITVNAQTGTTEVKKFKTV